MRAISVVLVAVIGGSLAADMWDPMSTSPDQCGKGMSCFYYNEGKKWPEQCDIRQCDQVMSVQLKPATNELDIEMHGKTDGYISMGFSNDVKMGEDEVYACQLNNRGTVDVRRYWNPNKRDPSVQLAAPVARPVASSLQFTDGKIYCRFTRPYAPREPRAVNVFRDMFHIVHAAGPVNMEQPSRAIMMHKMEHGAATEDKLSLMVFQDVPFFSGVSRLTQPTSLFIAAMLTLSLMAGRHCWN